MAHVRLLRMSKLPPLGWPSMCLPQTSRLLQQPRCYLCLASLLHRNLARTSPLPESPLVASQSASVPCNSSSDSRRSVQTRAAPAKLSRGNPRPPQRIKRTAQQPSQRPGRQKGTAGKEQQPAKIDSLDWGSSGSLKPSAALQARLDAIRTPAPAVVDTLESREEEPHSNADDAASPAQAGAIESGPEPSRDGLVEELELPAPSDVRIKSASYVTSSVRVEQCPKTGLPEFAVIGRSNVGKSSLINLLTGRKDLALVSKTPGKTRCINHFLINDSWYLVDLPGYGYAKQSQTSRVEWSKFTQEYFKTRETLVNVLLLVDGSVPTQNVDLGCAEWLAQNEVPFTLVFTKTDKRKKKCPPPSENIRQFEEELSKLVGALPVSLSTSATAKQGKGDLLTFVAQLRELHQRNLSFV